MLDEFLKVHIAENKRQYRVWMAINVTMVLLFALSVTGVI